MVEVSRLALSLYKHAINTVGRPLEFKDLGFFVKFEGEMAPKISVIPFPFGGLGSDGSRNSSSPEDANKNLYRMQLYNSIRDGESFIEIKVPTNRQGSETLMFLDEVKIPSSKVVERPGQSKKITDALCAGMTASGFGQGFSRSALHYQKYNGEVGDKPVKLEANYDETDELLRRVRVRMDAPNLPQPEFDERIIVALVDQYLLEVNDSTPARFS